LLADHDARFGGVDGDAALLQRALDDDLRDASGLQLFAHELTDRDVLMQQRRELRTTRVPARVPRTVDAEAQTDRIDFLTHYAASAVSGCFVVSRSTMVSWEKCFSMRTPRPRARACMRFIVMFLPTCACATTRPSTSR